MKNKNNKNNIYVYIIILILCIFVSIIIYNVVKDNNKKNDNQYNEEEIEEDDIVEAVIKPFDEEKVINVTINGKEYNMVLENNLAALDLLSVAPLELNMEDLNNNEKYAYLSYSLSNSDLAVGSVSKGDVMLYQSNCIVIFYQDFETTYSYTKLGHIDNLEELGTESVIVSFNK